MGLLATRGIVKVHITYAVLPTQAEAIVRDVVRTVDTKHTTRRAVRPTGRTERTNARREYAYFLRWYAAEDHKYDDTVRRIDMRANAEKRVNAFHPEGPSLMPGHRTIRTERRINGATVHTHENDGAIGNIRWQLAN